MLEHNTMSADRKYAKWGQRGHLDINLTLYLTCGLYCMLLSFNSYVTYQCIVFYPVSSTTVENPANTHMHAIQATFTDNDFGHIRGSLLRLCLMSIRQRRNTELNLVM